MSTTSDSSQSSEECAERAPDGRFLPGRSGNPTGKPLGRKAKITLRKQQLENAIRKHIKTDDVRKVWDRIVQDAVFNKIGTYSVAVLAHEHKIPFYVAAPKSTFDLTRVAADVEVEERKPEEVTHIAGVQIAPNGVAVMNPAFDATPLKYVTGIITESRVYYSKDFASFKK